MKIPALISILLIFFLSITNMSDSTAQPAWARVTPTPQENHINDITKIPGTNKIIAVGEGSTVMISDDEGETWQLILNPGGLANDFPLNTVYFYNSTIGFIGGKYYFSNGNPPLFFILRTTDGGLSWMVNTEIPGKVNDFHFINQDIGFAPGSNGNLLKTTDGGENWFDIESSVNFSLYSIDFCNDSTGYIVGFSFEKVVKTNDYGNTWIEVNFNSPLTIGYLKKIQFVNNTTGFALQHYGSILKTMDAGVSWEIVYSNEDIMAYTIDFFDENHGIAGCYKDFMQSCILATHDGGNTWSEFTLPEFQWDNYSVCCFDATNFLFCGLHGMIYKSINGGITWNPKYERKFWGTIYQVQYLDDNIVFCLYNHYLHVPYPTSYLLKSIDGGENYFSIADFLMGDYNLKTPAAFHFIDDNLGYLTYYHYENLLTVHKTYDGGNIWEEVESCNFDDKPYAVHFYDEYNGLISGLGFILKTSDGGNNWEKVYSFYLFYDLMDIHYFNANEVLVAGGGYSNTVLVKSYDGGATWEEMPLGLYGTIYDMEVINTSIYLACGDNVILKSPDGGNTWQYTQINNPNNIEFHSIHFPTENTGYAVGSGPFETMVKTTDDGVTWNIINSGITAGLNAVHFIDEYTGFVYGEKGVVIKTTTGGTTAIEDFQLPEQNTHFSVYPNPFTKSFTIHYQLPAGANSGTFEIISLNGKRILNHQLKNSRGYIEFPCENLKPRIYLIVLKTENNPIETQKIIKLH